MVSLPLCSDALVYTLDFMEIPLKHVIVNCEKLTCTIKLIRVLIFYSEIHNV